MSKKEPRHPVRGLGSAVDGRAQPAHVASAGRREECVSDQRVPLDNLIRPPLKKKKRSSGLAGVGLADRTESDARN